ncbi:MAG: flagellar motor switch protein FliM [Chthoniobacter sp.]|jgi:flagellar motor switch protein FliM|nr:flagellar motor switch protein FliM [Chthoniobacter sp.]
MPAAPASANPKAPAAVKKKAAKGKAAVAPPAVIFRCDGTRIAETEKVIVEPVDFRNPTFLAEGELRRLRSVHHDFVRALSSRLSSLLRSELALNLGKFGTQSCETFIEALKNPSQIALFRVPPLAGIGFVEIPTMLAVALTNRILGGREPAVNPDAYLTEIETALLEDVIAIITKEWCEQWRDATAMSAQVIGHETNPRFIQATEKHAMMLVIGIEVAFGRCEEIIQIAVPLSMIEPMVKRMHAAHGRDTGQQSAERNPSWRNSYDEIAIPVHAELVAARMTVAAVLQLKPGDLIELPAAALEATQINVAGAVRFTARAGQQNGYIAVQIAEKKLPSNK